jgi:hypothetical protein
MQQFMLGTSSDADQNKFSDNREQAKSSRDLIYWFRDELISIILLTLKRFLC